MGLIENRLLKGTFIFETIHFILQNFPRQLIGVHMGIHTCIFYCYVHAEKSGPKIDPMTEVG